MNCSANCSALHSLKFAMFELDVGKTKLYELMAGGKIRYVVTDYGRKISHKELRRYVRKCAARVPVANASEQIRKENRAAR